MPSSLANGDTGFGSLILIIYLIHIHAIEWNMKKDEKETVAARLFRGSKVDSDM